MDYETYTQRIKSINEQLEEIAELTYNQALIGMANPDNPHFNALMREHERLTKLSSELSNRVFSWSNKTGAVKGNE